MQEFEIFSGCGTLCTECEWYKGEKEPHCVGCTGVEGKPFWGKCKLYSCMQENNVKHCGICGVFPCDLFMDSFDPSKGAVSAAIRAGILAYRTKHGDEKAILYIRKIKD